LEMHPEKSGIVYCKDSLRRKDYPRISFTFLGYEFRPRSSKKRDGKIWTSFLPAISASAMKRIRQEIREWNLPRQTSVSLNELARRYNPNIRGWMNYYSHFYKSALYGLYNHLDRKLIRWAQRKYRKLKGKPTQARAWLKKVVSRQPRLFVHWLAHGTVAVQTIGAV
jgi:RNA-directed DNA polymerase